mgnify:CR=1 FL=1
MTRVVKITYTTRDGDGEMQLQLNEPDFSEKLRKIEQLLADTGAQDIVYTTCENGKIV